MAQDGAKLAPNWVQKSTQNGVPHRTWSGANMEANNLQTLAKMGPKHPNTNPKTSQNERQNRIPHRTVRWGTPLPCGKNRFKKATQQKRGQAFHSAPPLEPKKWPTWPQVGLQNRSKIDKKSMQKSIVFLMPLGIDFWVDFGGSWVPKSSQVGTKMGSKIDVNFERRFFQKSLFF